MNRVRLLNMLLNTDDLPRAPMKAEIAAMVHATLDEIEAADRPLTAHEKLRLAQTLGALGRGWLHVARDAAYRAISPQYSNTKVRPGQLGEALEQAGVHWFRVELAYVEGMPLPAR